VTATQDSAAREDVRTYPFGAPDRLELHPMYAYLREHEPLCRVRLPYGDEAWLVTRYEDLRRALGDARFSRAVGLVRDRPRLTPDRPRGTINDTDPPEHSRLRRLIAKAFTARRVEQLRPRATQIVDGLLTGMVQAGPPVDLVESLALPLPVMVICELLGVPYADRASFQVWTSGLMATTALTPEQRGGHIDDVSTYLAGLVGRRRREPTDDLLGALVLASDEGDRLTERELISLAMTVLAAGHETTANQIANSAYLLLTRPDQLALLRSRPDPIPGAVEELLRFVPLAATAGTPRYATADVELTGGTVPAGDAVMVFVPAANRDPRVFPDPDRLDVSRLPAAHLALGHGAHHCLGAGLARMELQVALGSLLERFPGLRLAVDKDELRWKAGTLVRGPVAVPVAW
jgi:cytochrome P450